MLRVVRQALQAPAILAVSGGRDSTGLALLAAFARNPTDPPPVVAWVDHAARPASEQDGEVVRHAAQRLGLPFLALTLDPADVPHGDSVEHWLRERRFDALCRAALEMGRSAVLTGHTRDDQAETVLMRLLAGPTGRGWHGMRLRRDHVVDEAVVTIHHPLLDLPRSTLHAWVDAAGLPTVDDPTNADTSLLRNRIRHDLLPVLDAIAPAWQTTLLRAARHSADDSAVLDALALMAASSIVVDHADHTDATISLSVDALHNLAQPIAVRVIRAAITPLLDGTGADLRDLSSERIIAVLRLASAQTGKVVQLPGGLTVRRTRTLLVVERHEAATGEAEKR